jgi:hypothetical protein
VFGWTQLVCFTDGASGGFEMDPIAIYQQIPTPFAWFGIRPELFDAQARESRYDLDRQAHSFLCISPDAVITRRVRAVAGFSWGFTINDQTITIAAPQVLGPQAWDSHLGLLRNQCLNGPSIPGTRHPERSPVRLTQRSRPGRKRSRRCPVPTAWSGSAGPGDAKKPKTRADRVVKTVASLRGGKRSR